MDNNLTIDTLSFKLVFSDKNGSERREISRGVNLPEVMSIKHTAYKDSQTKKPGVLSSLRFERHLLSSDGSSVIPVSATLSVRVPTDTGIVSSDVLAVVQRIVSAIQEDDLGLDLADEVFVNREQ